MSEQTVTATLDKSTAALLLMGGVMAWAQNVAATPGGLQGFNYVEAVEVYAASGDEYAARLCDARGALGFQSWEDARLCALAYAMDEATDG